MTRDPKHTPQELRERLTPLQYHVTQEKGTERPFTGEYAAHTAAGTYYCVGSRHRTFCVGEEFLRGSAGQFSG